MKRILCLLIIVCGILSSRCVFAQSLSFTKEEKNVIKKRNGALGQSTQIVCEDALASIRIKYRVASKDKEHLAKLIYDRECRKLAHNYIENNPIQRMKEKMRIDSLFQDSIDALLIPYNHDISGKCISMALQFSDNLKLNSKKRKFLMDKALSFARRKRQNPTAMFAKEEMDALKKTLSRNQIEYVLNEKNRLAASVSACQIWNDLEKTKLTVELDSANQMYLLNKFFLLDMMYHDYYVGDDETMRNNLEELYKHRPDGIRMHEALNTRKRVNAEAKEEKKKRVSNTYAW